MKNNRFLRGLVSAGLSAVIALSAVGCGSSSSSAGFNAAEAAEAAESKAVTEKDSDTGASDAKSEDEEDDASESDAAGKGRKSGSGKADDPEQISADRNQKKTGGLEQESVDYSIYDDAVEDYYFKDGDYTDNVGNEIYFNYSIPEITADIKCAKEINDEIKGKYEYYAKNEMKTMKEGYSLEYVAIGWYSCRFSSVLSIIVYADDNYGFTEYSVFNCDLASGKRIYSNDELMEYFGVDRKTGVEATRDAAEYCFTSGHEGLTAKQRKESSYDEALERTRSDEYIVDGAMMYVDDYGEFMAVLPVASLAGADWYYWILDIGISAGYDPGIGKDQAGSEDVLYLEKHAPDDEEALAIFGNDADVQNEKQFDAMTSMATGEVIEIKGEQCSEVALGTDHKENFVIEDRFAVSSTGAIYLYDILEDEWFPFNLLARIYSGWNEDVLFVAFTDPMQEAYWYACDGENCTNGVSIVIMQSGAQMTLEEVEYVEKTGEFHVINIVKDVEECARGQSFHFEIEPAETIPQYRISVHLGDQVAEWYITYDGYSENGTVYVTGFDANAVG